MFGMGTGGSSLLSSPDLLFLKACTLKTKQCFFDFFRALSLLLSSIFRFALYDLLYNMSAFRQHALCLALRATVSCSHLSASQNMLLVKPSDY